MRFPWLQVDADFIAAHANDLGAHLGISRREAIGLAVDLWTWALARSPDDAPPSGIITGPGTVPDRLLSGSVGWTGPDVQFVEALLSCGLAVRIDGGYRLTGFSRYKATWEKNKRRPGPKPDDSRTGSAPVPDRKTHTYTQKKEPSSLSASADDPDELPDATDDAQPVAERMAAAMAALPEPLELLPVAKPEKPKRKAEPKGDARHAPLVDALVKADAEVHGVPYGFRGGRDAKAVSECLALADQNPATAGEAAPAEILRRWRIARRWKGFPACNSLGDLATHWNAYARAQDGSTAPPAPAAPRKMMVL